ncbi:hypothetical protein C8R44DRAFT_738796 [Mycena epipterygia]|nr:hypothetical protein C8R44DRAFT_738796 [Mycena epipterygia]
MRLCLGIFRWLPLGQDLDLGLSSPNTFTLVGTRRSSSLAAAHPFALKKSAVNLCPRLFRIEPAFAVQFTTRGSAMGRCERFHGASFLPAKKTHSRMDLSTERLDTMKIDTGPIRITGYNGPKKSLFRNAGPWSCSILPAELLTRVHAPIDPELNASLKNFRFRRFLHASSPVPRAAAAGWNKAGTLF